jgi:predicted nucleic acid-binding protein
VRRLVVDPGVLVSALITPLGAPAEILRAVAEERVGLVVCPHLLAELLGVPRREKFRAYVTVEEAERYVAGSDARRVRAAENQSLFREVNKRIQDSPRASCRSSPTNERRRNSRASAPTRRGQSS